VYPLFYGYETEIARDVGEFVIGEPLIGAAKLFPGDQLGARV
jgi:hypothetical protein